MSISSLTEDRNAIRIIATAKTTGQTGVEMEALTAASVAALTIYDMVKAVEKAPSIERVRLLRSRAARAATSPRPHAGKASLSPRRSAIARAPDNADGCGFRSAADQGRRQSRYRRQREAFRAFMTSRQLRATEWAKEAGVPAAHIYAFLTGGTFHSVRRRGTTGARRARARRKTCFE